LPDVPSSVTKLRTPAERPNTRVASGNGSTALPADGSGELPVAIGLTSADVTAAVDSNNSDRVPASEPVASSSVITPLAPERYKVQFTADAQVRADLQRAQALLRHAIPDGDLGAVIGRALKLLVRHLEKTRLAATEHPRQQDIRVAPSRDVPAAMRRAVLKRDGERCAYTSPEGRRCTAEDFLQIDHIVPWEQGGETRVDNLRVLCRTHNRHVADLAFGREYVERRIAEVREKRKKQSSATRAGPEGNRRGLEAPT
jgi:5-methylcytosine-specific restriction endonuclease McrA